MGNCQGYCCQYGEGEQEAGRAGSSLGGAAKINQNQMALLIKDQKDEGQRRNLELSPDGRLSESNHYQVGFGSSIQTSPEVGGGQKSPGSRDWRNFQPDGTVTLDYSEFEMKTLLERVETICRIVEEHCENIAPQTLPNGATYKGEWNNSKRQGMGIQNWTDGTKYVGQWENDKASGIGKLYHADGDLYSGQWKLDKAHGLGRYKHEDESAYEGRWEHDRQHGVGMEEWQDGAKYIGQFQNGEKEGKGTLFFADGSVYEGQF